MVESPLVGDTEYPFRRTLAPLADRSAIIALTTSGFTVLPGITPPPLPRPFSIGWSTRVTSPNRSLPGIGQPVRQAVEPMTLASTDVPLPTVLADSA
jgi:hypothetical protein